MSMMKVNRSDGQVQCCYCEELIHSYATRCPYCFKDVIPSEETLLEQPEQKDVLPLLRMDDEEKLGKKESEKPPIAANQTFYMLLSLGTLLAGSMFFFFGILIKLFSKDGVFTLAWSVNCWPYFVFSAVVLILFGLTSLSKIES